MPAWLITGLQWLCSVPAGCAHLLGVCPHELPSPTAAALPVLSALAHGGHVWSSGETQTQGYITGPMCQSRPLPPALTAPMCPAVLPARLARGRVGQRPEMCQEAAPRKGTGVGLQARLGIMGIVALAISTHFKREVLLRFILNWDNNGQMQMVLVEWDIQPYGAFPGGNHKHPMAGVPPRALDLVEIGQGFCNPQERQPREPESCGDQQDYSLWVWRVPAAGAQPHCLVFMARQVFKRGLCMAAWVGFVPSWVCLR